MLYKDTHTFANETYSVAELYTIATTYAKEHHISSNFTNQEFSKKTLEYLGAYKRRSKFGNEYKFPEHMEIMKHLFKIDKEYYRHIHMLDENETPIFDEV